MRRAVPRLRGAVAARGGQGVRADGAEGREGGKGADRALRESPGQSFLDESTKNTPTYLAFTP